jgi:hypothetical protein
MTMRSTTTRRLLLRSAAAIVAAAWFGRLLGSWSPSGAPGEPDSARLARLLTQTDSARMIGQEYLRSAPGERDLAVLASLIVARLADDPHVDPRVVSIATDAHLRGLLLTSTRRDFAEGLTVTLDGWVLSRTEARLYGLTALT